MRIAVTADLHFGHHPTYDRATRKIVRQINGLEADLLILAGDTAVVDNGSFEECLHLFQDFPGRRLLVAGNHDLWTLDGNSWEIYTTRIPEFAERHGFHYLDNEPFVQDNVAVVGNIGWYDYSFRKPELEVPMRMYERKTLPGACRWNDVDYIRWPYSDVEFTERTLSRLEAHLERIKDNVTDIVCVTHHIPFSNMVTRRDDVGWSFGNAFMGSQRIGELLLKYDKVCCAICGHSHIEGRYENGHIQCINVGSTYRHKRCVVLEVG